MSCAGIRRKSLPGQSAKSVHTPRISCKTFRGEIVGVTGMSRRVATWPDRGKSLNGDGACP